MLNTKIFRGLCEHGRQGSAHVEGEMEVRPMSVISLVDNNIKQLKEILMINRQGYLQTSGISESV